VPQAPPSPLWAGNGGGGRCCPQLKQGFETHLAETKEQVKRLDRVFQLHGEEPSGVDCPAIDGIIEEAEDVASEAADKSVPDAALIAAAQAVEHYEIARYGTLIAWANQLGHADRASLLQQNLQEEKGDRQEIDGACRIQGQSTGSLTEAASPPGSRATSHAVPGTPEEPVRYFVGTPSGAAVVR
jgi:ferritin-like metal-binding protein YciE